MDKLLIIMVLALLIVSSALRAAPVVTGDLLELIDVEKAAYLRDSICTQVSSYDRTGGNDDGFSGAYSFIRKEGEDFVIFDEEGPGCLYRIWSANPHEGWIKFYFDGEETPRVHANSFEDLFQDKVYPFVSPISQHFLGGWCSYIPIPFEKSLKIVAQGPVRFLQFTWHKFPTSEGVTTFSTRYSRQNHAKLMQVKEAWMNLGQPPMPFPDGTKSIRKNITVAAGASANLAKLQGSGLVRALKIKPVGEGTKFLRKTVLTMNVDGQKTPSICSPVGDFFLDGFGEGTSKSLVVGKDGDTYYSYWVMPYASGASLDVKNDSTRPVQLSYEIVYEPLEKLPDGMGRFFAWWHRQNPTVSDELFPILNAQGSGHWCGVSHAMRALGGGLGYLEGDEMLWIDDRDHTFFNGTGTEDYFNGGWYFGATGSAAFYGCGVLADPGVCHAYRIHITDLVPFQRTARIGIEHGHANESRADYAGVTYGYAGPGMIHDFQPADVAERVDRPSTVFGVVEAESIFDSSSSGKIIDDLHEPFFLSDGKAVSTSSGEVGESFALSVEAPSDGAYQITVGFQEGPDRGRAQLLIDGQPFGEVIDTYAEALTYGKKTFVGVTPEVKQGVRTLTVKSAGKNEESASAGVVVDFVNLKPALWLEGEDMQIVSKSNCDVTVQELFRDYSNGAHMWIANASLGAMATLEFSLPRDDTYPIVAWLTKASDYGVILLSIDGRLLGTFDGYDQSLTRESIKFGDMELTAGKHQLTIEVLNKNEKSSGYLAGLDVLVMQ